MARKKKEIILPEPSVEVPPKTDEEAQARLRLVFQGAAYREAVALYQTFRRATVNTIAEAYHWVVSRKEVIISRNLGK